MATAGSATHATIDVAGRSSGEVAAAVSAVVAADGSYSHAATGPDTLQLVRTFRPSWVIVLGVLGLPFLGLGILVFLVKKTESCTLKVVNGPTGAVLAVAGTLLPSTLAALRGALERPGTTVAASPAPAGLPADLPSPTAPAVTSAPPLGSPVAAPAPSGARITAPAPMGQPVGGPPPLEDLSAEGHTIFRVARPVTSATPAPAGGFWLRLPEGRVITLTGTTLLGRDPAPLTTGEQHSSLVAIDDPSMQVSKTHLALHVSDGSLHAEDLHSTNGTVISEPSGRSLTLAGGESAPVHPGAVLQVGGVRIEVGVGG